MRDNRFITKLMALILAAAMTLPAAVFALDEPASEELSADAPAAETVIEEEEAAEEIPDAPAEEEPVAPAAEPGFIENLTIEENPMGTVVISWDAFSGASLYEVSSASIDDGAAAGTESCSQTFTGLKHGEQYDFVVAALDENGVIIARSVVSITTAAYSITFDESLYRTLSSRTVSAKRKSGNLTTMIKEKNNGYAVVQGGCTDGTYAYYLMVSTSTQKGRVLKVKLSNNKVAARSKILKTWHGNGMAYDSKRKKLVVIAREHRKQEITVIDAKTLKITRQGNVKYSNYAGAGSGSLNETHQEQGLAAIAYVAKYDCYIALERVYHNLLIFDPDTFEAIGMVYTTITDEFPGTYQAMDADDKYVYLLLSYYDKYGKVQPDNVIVTLDWNSENLLPVVNASKSLDPTYVEDAWYCNNDGSGRPDAALRINTSHEAENIYHTTDSKGNEHFYLSEYYGHGIYKTVTKKVKVNGKWKKTKVKKLKYFKRDNYVYDLGVI